MNDHGGYDGSPLPKVPATTTARDNTGFQRSYTLASGVSRPGRAAAPQAQEGVDFEAIPSDDESDAVHDMDFLPLRGEAVEAQPKPEAFLKRGLSMGAGAASGL